VIELHGSPVVWSSRRQATVSASTVEPEYIALTEAGREVMRLRELLGTLGHRQPMTKLWCDNQGAIALTKKPSSHPRIKHIAIRHHHTRMGRTRDDSTRVRGYEVPEGRHPHQTVAWTGARGLCTRNRSSEAKEGRKGCRTKTQPWDLRRRDSGWRSVTRADLGPEAARKHVIRRNDRSRGGVSASSSRRHGGVHNGMTG
jgi:hypothetical protein